jgi:hypothetical protein
MQAGHTRDLGDTQDMLAAGGSRASMPAGEPSGLVGGVEEDVDEVHAPPAVTGGEALAVGGEGKGEEGEVAIAAGDLLPARDLPQPQREVVGAGDDAAAVGGCQTAPNC